MATSFANDAPWGKCINRVSHWFERAGLIAMAAMGLTTLIDVIGSKFFQRPLPGSTELTGVLQVIAIAGGLAYSKIDGQHIRVEFLIDLLPKTGKIVLELFSALLGLAVFLIAGWVTFQHGMNLLRSGTSTFLLGIPLYPFVFWISLSCIPMALVILWELIQSAQRIID